MSVGSIGFRLRGHFRRPLVKGNFRMQDERETERQNERPNERLADRRAAQELRSGTRLGSNGTRISGYLLSWIALAAFAFGYIGVAATRPDLLPGVIPLNDQGGEQLAGARSTGDLADEIASLRKWVNDLQHEMVAAKTSLQNGEQQQHALLQRMTAAEERLSPVREIRADVPPARGRAAEAKPLPVAAVALPPMEPKPEEPTVALTASGIKLINGGAASEIVTSSVIPSSAAPSSIAAPSATVTPTQAFATQVLPSKAAVVGGGIRAIEIADAESLDGLRNRWAAISSQNAAALKRLEPRYRISAANNSATPFTLLAGPFNSTADAARACAQLRANGVTCRVGEFAGNGL